jgi:hypothetical protein
MGIEDEAPLKDYAETYIKQIVEASDDEIRLYLIREFGEKAYSRGYKAALAAVRNFIDGA